MNVHKIIIIGGYGFGNVGDESQLAANLLNLKRYLKNAQFLVLSANPEHTSKYHQVPTDYSMDSYLLAKPENRFLNAVYKFFPKFVILLRGVILLANSCFLKRMNVNIFLNEKGKRLLNNLKSGSILFNSGGGNLTSTWRIEGLYSKCLTYLVCAVLKKPIVLSGQTIGPFNNWLDRKFAKFALNRVDVITLRENTSQAILEALGVTNPIIKVIGDDAIGLPCADDAKVTEIFVNEKIQKHHPMIVITVRRCDPTSLEKVTKIVQTMTELADCLISQLGARIVFLPMYHDDIAIASEIVRKMRFRDKVNVIANVYDGPRIKGFIGQADIVIGLRYHSLVFATSMMVPSIGIYWNQYSLFKIKGVLEIMGQEKYACDVDRMSVGNMMELVLYIFSNKSRIREQLEERIKNLQTYRLYAIKRIVNSLGET